MWPFRRRSSAPDPAESLLHQARLLTESADRVTAEACALAERERAFPSGSARLDARLARDANALDERRDALALLGRELRDREARVEQLEQRSAEIEGRAGELDERERRLASDEVEARRRAEEVDAREQSLREREEELHAREARLLADELGVRRRSEEVAAREAELSGQPKTVAEPQQQPQTQPGPERCLLFVPGADGYRLVALDVSPPAAGESVEIDGERFNVVRTGRSPLPGDARPCVYLAA
jgi:hypothetical protein